MVRDSFTVFAVLCLAWGLMSCAPKRAQAPAQPQKTNAVALLSEEDGTVGRIAVSNQAGSVDLIEANSITRVPAADVAPATPVAASSDEINRLFASALETLPTAQAEFVFYFETGNDQLTAESEALIPELLRVLAERRSTDVSITGHTDTTDNSQANYTLGLRRAERVAEILRQRGLDSSFLTVESHGEADLLIPTADGVEEARNRRVEVIVR